MNDENAFLFTRLFKVPHYFANFAVQFFLSPKHYCFGGKSGQHRAPCYLTGRLLIRKGRKTASVTETKPSRQDLLRLDKGEKAG